MCIPIAWETGNLWMRDNLAITSVHHRYVRRYVSTQEEGKEKFCEGGEGNPNQAPACLKFVLAKSKPY